MNDTTKRFPRTLFEAFGPHTSRHIEEPKPQTLAHEWALYVVALGAALVLMGVL